MKSDGIAQPSVDTALRSGVLEQSSGVFDFLQLEEPTTPDPTGCSSMLTKKFSVL
jgi:hypothetical protein